MQPLYRERGQAMKMRLFDRILLTIYTLVIIGLSLFSFVVAWGFIPKERMTDWIDRLYVEWSVPLIVTVISLLLLIVGFRLLFSGIRRHKPKSTLLKNTELGGIRVSLNTIDGLAQKSARSYSGIRDVKSEVIAIPEGVRILLKISIIPDVNIPELTEQLQMGIKEYVEKLTGIYVKEIQVYVDNPIQNK